MGSILGRTTFKFALLAIAIPALASAEATTPVGTGPVSLVEDVTARSLAYFGNPGLTFSPKEIARSTATGTLRNAESIALLWTLLFGRLVYERSKLQPVEGTDAPSIASLSAISFKALRNNFGLYASTVCAEAAGCALNPGLRAFEAALARAGTNSALLAGLTAVARNAVVFGAFAAGDSLVAQATFALDEEDQKIARDLPTFDVLTGRGTPRQREVATKILRNAFGILTIYQSPAHSAEWVYNTFRLNMTGDFLTTLTAMTGSMAVAGALVGTPATPIGSAIGMVTGFAAGLVGGVIAYFAPSRFKDGVSDAIYAERVNAGNIELARNEALLSSYQRFLDQPDDRFAELHAQGFARTIEFRANVLDRVVTVFAERIHHAFGYLQSAENVLHRIDAKSVGPSPNPELGAYLDASTLRPLDASATAAPDAIARLNVEYATRRDYARAEIERAYDELLEAQDREAGVLEKFAGDASESFPTSLKIRAEELRRDQAHLRRIFGEWKASLLSEAVPGVTDAARARRNVSAQVLLNLYYLRGFSREPLLRRSPSGRG